MNQEQTRHQVPAESLLHVVSSPKNNKGAAFTVRSTRTGKDYTYKIARREYKGHMCTNVSIETEYMNFQSIGSYMMGRIKKWDQDLKMFVLNDSDAANGIAFVIRAVMSNDKDMMNQFELFHTGNCPRCGKELTDATSIEIGIGPTCRK